MCTAFVTDKFEEVKLIYNLARESPSFLVLTSSIDLYFSIDAFTLALMTGSVGSASSRNESI